MVPIAVYHVAMGVPEQNVNNKVGFVLVAVQKTGQGTDVTVSLTVYNSNENRGIELQGTKNKLFKKNILHK